MKCQEIIKNAEKECIKHIKWGNSYDKCKDCACSENDCFENLLKIIKKASEVKE